MTILTDPNALLQIILYFSVIFLLVKPLGIYMAKVYTGEKHLLSKPFGIIETSIYKLASINPKEEMGWQDYAFALLYFSAAGFAALFLILVLQNYLPLNPQELPGLRADLAFNVAASFISNTNWQSYSGEATLSHFSQIVGLTVQNFLSAAVGMSVAAALMRGLSRSNANTVGNFWVDLVRTNIYILIPLAIILSAALASQGVPQTFDQYKNVKLLQPITLQNAEGKTETLSSQKIAVGPVASQVAIKQLGTNGGGFFNVNSAHPLENPNALSNFLQMLAILLIPAALCYSFGRMVGDTRQGWVLLIAMTLIFIPITTMSLISEQNGNKYFASLGIDQNASDLQPGGNMEGKEARFGITSSVLWQTATTAASNGSVNSMHDSYTPLGGMAAMMLIQCGEVVYGGVGSGLYGIIIFAILTVFIAGLMIGRTPEYLGKKIGDFEIKMASIAMLIPGCIALIGTALSVVTESGLAGIQAHGPHGFSQVLYAFSSVAMNNGSSFAGLVSNTPYYNTLQAIIMLFGRYWVIVPVLAISGSMAAKKSIPPSSGTLPTHTLMFTILLVCIIIMIGLLTFVPSLVLGPMTEFITANG